MISETKSRRANPAITSDRWHVVRACWDGSRSAQPRFQRAIVSEHDDRASATRAARELHRSIASEMEARAPRTRDQIFVRKPDFKSLKSSARLERRR
jgi:hypothetical protein